jgi:hypothetical protein
MLVEVVSEAERFGQGSVALTAFAAQDTRSDRLVSAGALSPRW